MLKKIGGLVVVLILVFVALFLFVTPAQAYSPADPLDCIEECIPEKPHSVTTTEEYTELLCDVQKANVYIESATRDWILVGTEWVLSEEVVYENAVIHRDVFVGECPVVEEPVITPPVVETLPVVETPVTDIPIQEPYVPLEETLPETGVDWVLLPVSLILMICGIVLTGFVRSKQI